jgi:hypothetical protein
MSLISQFMPLHNSILVGGGHDFLGRVETDERCVVSRTTPYIENSSFRQKVRSDL